MGTIMKNNICYSGGGQNGVTISLAEYNALPETEQKNGTVYFIYDAPDEGSGVAAILRCTQEEYNNLEQKDENTLYVITDSNDIAEASQIIYDNSNSGLTSVNVQSAIDELKNTSPIIKTITGSKACTGGGVNNTITLSYPSGFNKNNCAVICELYSTDGGTTWESKSAYYTKGAGAYINTISTVLNNSNINVILQVPDAKTVNYKVILMKI